MVNGYLEVVINKKDNKKILYKVVNEDNNKCLLSGLNHRVMVEVERKYIEKATEHIINSENIQNESYYAMHNERSQIKKCLLGTVLHIDMDEDYLKKCVDLYRSVGVYVYPVLCKAKEMSEVIADKKINFNPDVIVLTGHDYFYGKDKSDVENYMNSKHFVKAVLCARRKYPNSVIIAGACQSLFEALMASGANFASSPKRKNIHVYDPAILAITACITSHKQIINFNKAGKHIEDFNLVFGGVETYGKMKILY